MDSCQKEGCQRSWLAYRIMPLLLIALILSGCGKIGEPLPPIPRSPLIVDDLRVSQEGSHLVLRIPLNRSSRTRQIDRIEVYRLIESGNDPAGLPPESFIARAAVVASVTADKLPNDRSTVTYLDTLDLTTLDPGARYRYAVQIVNISGVAADISNYATIVPLSAIALAPGGLKAMQQEREVILEWNAPRANVNGGATTNLTGYNIYRRTEGGESPPLKLNDKPITEVRFADRTFQFDKGYEYTVRALSLPQNAANSTSAIESDESIPLHHRPVDKFPPATPTSITIASINKVVSLFWPLNSEPDTAGYNIYRSESENAPDSEWRKLTLQPNRSASYRDDRVIVGKVYYYRITAIDRTGNESPRSAIVSETVAP